MKYKIKVLKDTPFDVKNTILSLDEFRLKYGYLISSDNSDQFVISYLKNGFLNDHHDITLSKWFEVVEIPENSFRVGDWVWHEDLKRAFCIMIHCIGKEWRPNYISLDAAHQFVDTFKRKATQEEINYYDLVVYAEKSILIGQYKSYYFNVVWKELIGISRVLLQYIELNKNLSQISILVGNTSEVDQTYITTLSGIIVGCKHVPHQELLLIAKHLKLIS
jgi:hypothetical protein